MAKLRARPHPPFPLSVTQAPALLRPSLYFVLAAAIVVKLALLALDAHPRFFFGDSSSYLLAATSDWVAPDRSPTLPLVLRHTAVATGSIWTWLLLQSVLGAISAALLFHWLRDRLAVAWPVAGVAALLLCVEPMQLYYERSLMAETLGTASVLGLLACAIAYLRSGRAVWLPAAAVLGVAAVSFRLSLLPVVLVLSALVPVLWMFRPQHERPALRRWLLHLALGLLSTWGLHQLYQQWSGAKMSASEPGYTANEGIFRLGWLAPLVEAHHLERLGIDGGILERLPYPVQDRRSREWQLWADEGLISEIRRQAGDKTDRVAGKISKRILRERPLAVLDLGVRSLGDHFDGSYARNRMDNDLGRNPPPPGFPERAATYLGVDDPDWRHLDAPAARWFALSRPVLSAGYFLLFLLAPITLWLAWRERSPVLALFAFTGFGLALASALFGHVLVFRYLHPMAPMLMILAAVLVDRLWRGRSTSSNLHS